MNTMVKPPQEAWSEEELLALGTGPIPASVYYDPARYEQERKAVFLRTWLVIGHMCELPKPGNFIVRDVESARASILVVHGKDGKVRAFHNVCTHRGTQLVQAKSGSASTFTCPYHAWTFGQDGQLRSAPDFERFYVAKKDCGLSEVRVETCGGLIFINFDKASKLGLTEFLGEAAGNLAPLERSTRFSEFTYDIDANWKVVFDNFQENYHLRFIHKTAPNAVGPENPFGYPLAYRFFGPHRTQTLWTNPDQGMPKPVQLKAYMNAAAEARTAGYPHADMKLFPNLHTVSYGGFFFVQRIMPLSVNRARSNFRLYWVGDEPDAASRFSREYVFASVRDVIAEDRTSVEAAQRGLESGALEHVHFQEHEIMLRHLYHVIDGMVEEYRAVQGASA